MIGDELRPKECEHTREELRQRTQTNGVVIAGLQCLDCGRWRSVKKPPDFASLPVFDESISENWERARSEEWQEWYDRLQQKRLDAVAEKNQAWWDWYTRYLESDEWKQRRIKVLTRDGHICQAQLECDGATATQVHHLTYAHVGNEPLFDLRSVCTACHETITEMDRKRRGEAA